LIVELFFDSPVLDDGRRSRAYDGDVFVYRPGRAAEALCAFTRKLLEEAFHPLSPWAAQHSLPVETFAHILAQLKPAFIHHPEAKSLLRDLLVERGCDLDQTYFDVPRLRSSTSDGYLTSGIAYAFHAHRDTWYSAPMCQLNWWLPVFPMPAQSGMLVHPLYWHKPVKNSSQQYDYARWNRESRYTAENHIHTDTRVQPRAEEDLNLDGGVLINGDPGSLAIFSAAQMHASAENLSGETRYSIDFRTVHFEDVAAGTGAANVDSQCSGTTLGDYLRGTDYAHFPAQWVQRYEGGWAR
jgi:hypothetical protein